MPLVTVPILPRENITALYSHEGLRYLRVCVGRCSGDSDVAYRHCSVVGREGNRPQRIRRVKNGRPEVELATCDGRQPKQLQCKVAGVVTTDRLGGCTASVGNSCGAGIGAHTGFVDVHVDANADRRAPVHQGNGVVLCNGRVVVLIVAVDATVIGGEHDCRGAGKCGVALDGVEQLTHECVGFLHRKQVFGRAPVEVLAGDVRVANVDERVLGAKVDKIGDDRVHDDGRFLAGPVVDLVGAIVGPRDIGGAVVAPRQVDHVELRAGHEASRAEAMVVHDIEDRCDVLASLVVHRVGVDAGCPRIKVHAMPVGSIDRPAGELAEVVGHGEGAVVVSASVQGRGALADEAHEVGGVGLRDVLAGQTIDAHVNDPLDRSGGGDEVGCRPRVQRQAESDGLVRDRVGQAKRCVGRSGLHRRFLRECGHDTSIAGAHGKREEVFVARNDKVVRVARLVGPVVQDRGVVGKGECRCLMSGPLFGLDDLVDGQNRVLGVHAPVHGDDEVALVLTANSRRERGGSARIVGANHCGVDPGVKRGNAPFVEQLPTFWRFDGQVLVADGKEGEGDVVRGGPRREHAGVGGGVRRDRVDANQLCGKRKCANHDLFGHVGGRSQGVGHRERDLMGGVVGKRDCCWAGAGCRLTVAEVPAVAGDRAVVG